jgi:hypothetical protein
MAKKLPLVPIAIAAGAGLGTYFAATQLSQRVAFFQQHPIGTPLTLAAVGVLIAKKHLPIGLGIAGAAGAIGYLQYKAGAAQPQAQPTPTQTSTTPAAYQPATTQPATPGAVPSTGTDPTGGAVQQGLNALNQGQGTDDGSGTTPSAGDGSTGTAGYSAGKLLSGPHMHSHLKTWRRGGDAGALLSGPRPHSHLAPWHRNAGHYDAPAPGEAGGLRGGAHGLTSD